MNKSCLLRGIAGLTLALGTFASTAMAATNATTSVTPQHQLQTKAIYFNNELVSKPSGFVVNKTTYMPVWYVMHTLDAVKITNTWTGTAWKITTPKGAKVDFSQLSVGKGSISIYINGTLVQKVDGIQDVDPSTGKQTTYMPIWYVMNILDRLQVKSGWDGKTWTLKQTTVTTSSGSSNGSSGGNTSTGTGTKSGSSGSGSGTGGGKSGSGTTGSTGSVSGSTGSSGSNSGTSSSGTGGNTSGGTGSSVSTGSGTDSSGSGGTSGSTSASSGTSGSTGNSSSGGADSGTGTGTTTPPAPPPPPVDTAIRATQLTGAVSKAQLISDLATVLNLPETSVPTVSGYDDLPVTSPYWAGDVAAIQQGLAQPFYLSTQSDVPSHFGAGDVVTLQDAEQFYWNYLNMQHTSYQPGGSLSAWANAIGLTQGLQQSGTYLTLADEQQFVQNLKGLLDGMVVNGSTVQMRYTPHDEYLWTFAGAVDGNGVPLYSGSAVQTAITKTYGFYNSITMQVVGNYLQVTIPIDSDKRWFGYARSQDGLQYSTDGGMTWTSAGSFDGSTVAASGSVILRAPLADGMSITYNNMLSQAKGSIILGWVNISQTPSASQIQSSGSVPTPEQSTGIIVDRVTLT